MEKLSTIFTKQSSLPTKILVIVMSIMCLALFLFVIVRNLSKRIKSANAKVIETEAYVTDKKFIPSPFSVRGYQVNEQSLAKDNIFLIDFNVNGKVISLTCKKKEYDEIEKDTYGKLKYKDLGKFGLILNEFVPDNKKSA